MRAAFSLVWKEWRELQWFLYIGLAAFLFVPSVEMIGRLLMHRAIASYTIEPVVLGLSGLLATIVGVGATCRDLDPRLRAFWQASPISLGRWLITKYVIGLAAVLLVCLIPLGLQIGLHASEMRQLGRLWRATTFATVVLACYTFTVVLLFSVAFMLGCVVRRASHAGILSVGAALLIHFLPIVFPPLRSLGVYNIMFGGFWGPDSTGSYWRFVEVMLAGSGLALLLSGIAVHRDWQLETGKRLIFWSVGIVALMLVSGAAFQLNANLTCSKQFAIAPPNLPEGQTRGVTEFISSGSSGVLLLHDTRPRLIGQSEKQYTVCRFDLAKSGLVLGREIVVSKAEPANKGLLQQPRPQVAWSMARPNRAYCLRTRVEGEVLKRDMTELVLLTVALDRPPEQAVTHKLDLLPLLPGKNNDPHSVSMCQYEGMIYVYRRNTLPTECRVALINLIDPDAPRVARVLEDQPWTSLTILDPQSAAQIPGLLSTELLRIPALSERDRLQLTVRLALNSAPEPEGFSGNLVVGNTPEGLVTCRLTMLNRGRVALEQCGWHHATPLEKLAGLTGVLTGRLRLQNGLVYAVDSDGLTVYDVRRPETPRRIGHYRASGQQFSDVLPLPDGRILVGGKKLHILAPPKLDRE